MSLNRVPAGRNIPDDFNVIIEIPSTRGPDQVRGRQGNRGLVRRPVHRYGDALPVQLRLRAEVRWLTTAIRSTSSSSRRTRCSLASVVRCRPLGVLKMEDEAGGDAKLLAVPIDKILPWYRSWQQWSDLAT